MQCYFSIRLTRSAYEIRDACLLGFVAAACPENVAPDEVRQIRESAGDEGFVNSGLCFVLRSERVAFAVALLAAADGAAALLRAVAAPAEAASNDELCKGSVKEGSINGPTTLGSARTRRPSSKMRWFNAATNVRLKATWLSAYRQSGSNTSRRARKAPASKTFAAPSEAAALVSLCQIIFSLYTLLSRTVSSMRDSPYPSSLKTRESKSSFRSACLNSVTRKCILSPSHTCSVGTTCREEQSSQSPPQTTQLTSFRGKFDGIGSLRDKILGLIFGCADGLYG